MQPASSLTICWNIIDCIFPYALRAPQDCLR